MNLGYMKYIYYKKKRKNNFLHERPLIREAKSTVVVHNVESRAEVAAPQPRTCQAHLNRVTWKQVKRTNSQKQRKGCREEMGGWTGLSFAFFFMFR